jgi:hypothetical protein
MIIDDADRFGLADLHQLRGRVGRYKHRAYCYLLLPRPHRHPRSPRSGCKAIEQYSMLGAGFKIAMRDLEIRGAGNLLGAEQSGHIAAVGYEMYCRLLEQAVKDLTRDAREQPVEPDDRRHRGHGVIPRAVHPERRAPARGVPADRDAAPCPQRREPTPRRGPGPIEPRLIVIRTTPDFCKAGASRKRVPMPSIVRAR